MGVKVEQVAVRTHKRAKGLSPLQVSLRHSRNSTIGKSS